MEINPPWKGEEEKLKRCDVCNRKARLKQHRLGFYYCKECANRIYLFSRSKKD